MKRAQLTLLVSVAAIISFACAKPFLVACRETAQDPQGQFRYNESQTASACSSAQFYADIQLFSYDKDKKIWTLNPNGLLTSDLEKVFQDQLESLNVTLSYRDQGLADFIDWFPGFRSGLEKQEQIALEILRRLNFIKAYNTFVDTVGELPADLQSKELSYFFPNGRKFYSMRLIYPRADKRIAVSIPFTAEYLEVAKRDGTLKLVDTFEIGSSQEFAKKIPNLQDANEFDWEKQERGWLMKSYKVTPDKDKPADNIAHYIEIFRKKKDMSGFEDKQAVRGFMSAGGAHVNVFVVDYDREGTHGYGSPDAVVKIFNDITTGSDIYHDPELRRNLMASLYDPPQNNQKDKPERKRPKDKQLYAAIVKMGEAQINVWEQGTWSVPFDYRILYQNLELMFAPAKTAEEKRLEEREKVKRLMTLIREFKQDGKTVVREYWIPKKEYTDWNIIYAFAGADTVTLRRKNGTEEKADVNYFARQIKAIDYFYGGRWFRIVDENGDGIFEKKRVISSPVGMETDSLPPGGTFPY